MIKRKIRLIESFIALDYIYFGAPFSKVDIIEDCPVCKDSLVNDYITNKAAILSVMKEMYKITGYRPKEKFVNKNNNHEQIKYVSKILAKNSIHQAKKIMQSEYIKESVKKKITRYLQEGKKLNIKNVINEKAYMIATDVLFFGSIVNECQNFNKLNSWIGLVIEDSYNLLKSSLIKNVMEIKLKRA